MLRRVGAGALVTIAAGLVLAAPANAFWGETTTFKQGAYGVVEIYAEPGETNDVTAYAVPRGDTTVAQMNPLPTIGGFAYVHDSKATVTPPPDGRGAGCVKVDDHTLRCLPSEPSLGDIAANTLIADLGDGDDKLTLTPGSGLRLVANGGDGNDVIKADDPLEPATLYGDAGNDRLTIRGQGDGVFYSFATSGGPGDDVLDLANGYDNLPSCGDGWDLVYADSSDTPVDDSCEDIERKPLPVGSP